MLHLNWLNNKFAVFKVHANAFEYLEKMDR